MIEDCFVSVARFFTVFPKTASDSMTTYTPTIPWPVKADLMKRFLIFLGVGPIVGFFVMMIVSGALRSLTADAVSGFFLFLPFVFIIGLVPALIAAIVDAMLECGGVLSIKRWLTVGVIGYLATYILVAPAYFEPNNIHSLDYSMGLIGGLAGILCSWLAEQHRDHQQAP